MPFSDHVLILVQGALCGMSRLHASIFTTNKERTTCGIHLASAFRFFFALPTMSKTSITVPTKGGREVIVTTLVRTKRARRSSRSTTRALWSAEEERFLILYHEDHVLSWPEVAALLQWKFDPEEKLRTYTASSCRNKYTSLPDVGDDEDGDEEQSTETESETATKTETAIKKATKTDTAI